MTDRQTDRGDALPAPGQLGFRWVEGGWEGVIWRGKRGCKWVQEGCKWAWEVGWGVVILPFPMGAGVDGLIMILHTLAIWQWQYCPVNGASILGCWTILCGRGRGECMYVQRGVWYGGVNIGCGYSKDAVGR